MITALILAAGEPSPEEQDDAYPIWLSELDGSLILERQVRALASVGDLKHVFLFRQSDVENYFLDSIVSQISPAATVIAVRHQTAGAACTALLATDAIDMEDELVLVSATDETDCDFGQVVEGFRSAKADAGVLTFSSLHPRYSYVRVSEEGWVVEAAEKRPISRRANAGFYWFRRASDFFEAACQMIMKDAHVHGRFYICPTLNELVLKGKRISARELEPHQYHPLKSETQFAALEYHWQRENVE